MDSYSGFFDNCKGSTTGLDKVFTYPHLVKLGWVVFAAHHTICSLEFQVQIMAGRFFLFFSLHPFRVLVQILNPV